MSGAWFAAFVIATVVALVATPLLARYGESRGRRRAPLATAAGPLLAVASTFPLVISEIDGTMTVALVGAVWLWCAGWLIDRGLMPSVLRRLAIGAAAVLVTASGLRLDLTGVEWVDVVLTIAIVWGATSAWRSAQTRDGLLLGWAAATAIGAGLLGGLAGQSEISELGFAVAGASFGFLAYVVPPVAARLRTGGALFLGFLSVVLALSIEPTVHPPIDVLAPLLLVALPLIDGIVTRAARLRGRGRDTHSLGLAGRWRALGVPRTTTTVGLVVFQAGLVFLALLVGRGVLDWAPALVAAAVLLALAVVPALFARMDAPPGKWPRWVLGVGVVVIGAVILLSAPAALALLRARTDTTAAANAAERGLAAARRGDAVEAEAAFAEAESRFGAARRRLYDPTATLGLQIPLLGPNLHAARELIDVGIDLSQAGKSLASTADPEQLRIVNATVNLAELERLQPEFENAARLLEGAKQRVDDIDTAYLVAPVEDAIAKLDRRLERAVRDSRTAEFASSVLPDILGKNSPRRYFLAVQNNAEARATGGFIGSYGDITANGGKLDLGTFARIENLNPKSPDEPRVLDAPPDYIRRYSRFQPERLWQNVNTSPDVPTVGAVEASLLPQSGFGPVDGVVTVDPIGLASVLKITGPINVADWPEPITADNVVDITMRQAYIQFADDPDRRESFLGDVADATWNAFSERDLGSPAALIKALSKATHSKHLTLWFANPDEEALARRAHADGALPRSPADLALVTTGNAGQNKIDYFLKRNLQYDLDLVPGPDGDAVDARGRLVTKLTNTAPAEGLPPYIIGPFDDRFVAGENRAFVTAYSSLRLTGTTLDGQPSGMESQRELGRWAYSNYVKIPAMSERTLDLSLAGRLRLAPDGWYELALLGQPSVNSDTAEVALRLPEGWRFVQGDGFRIANNGREVRFDGTLDHDRILRVRIERNYGDGLWGQLQQGG